MDTFTDDKLIEKYGSWVKLQVAFYDWIFITAHNTCAACLNEDLVNEFRTGGDAYQQMVKVTEDKYETFDQAWAAFLKDEGGIR